MDKTGTYQFAPESYMLDFRGRVTIPTLCSYMLHAASRHASSRGFGFGDMSGRHTAWVLSRIAIEMAEYPVMPAGPLTLHTWISDVSRLFTCRCFECVGDAGRTVGYAHSTWAAIDVATRRPVPLDGEALRAYLVDDRPCPVMRPGKIPAVEGTAPGEPYRVRYSDLDVNGHFNSIKYMEHLLDMFDIALFRDGEVRRFEIAYLSEGTHDMTLTFHMAGAGEGRYHMAVCHEGRAVCRAAVVWE